MYWSQYPTIRYKPNPQLTKDKNHVSFFLLFVIQCYYVYSLTHQCIISQNGLIHFKNFAANAERFLKCVSTLWDIMH